MEEKSSFNHLRKNLRKDFSELKKIKVAVLGDSSTQFLVKAIRGDGYNKGYDIDIWEADFNQIEHQILNDTSEFYEYKPEIVIIFQSSHKLLEKYNKQSPKQNSELASREMESIQNLLANVNENLNAKIIYYNYSEINDSVFGNFSNSNESSFLFQLRKLNYELMSYSSTNSNLYLCDLSSIQNKFGKDYLFKPSIYINTDMVLNIDVLPEIASITNDLICALQGKIKKCVIIDLDNTTWGGVIGDDGLENIQIGSLGIGKAFTEFQYWIKKLKNRGIIVAVCSKNTDSVARKPFVDHPDMVLRLDDISLFVANWENKADNIRYIQSVLNIGFDSMVFIDDNPFERNIVRDNLPDVLVPELPEDPAEYLEYLYSLNLFETTSYSNEDSDRTKLYQTEAKRASSLKKFTDVNDFLKSLEMKSEIQPFNKFNTPRVSQLSQRSNQFNLRTIRYTEEDIKRMSDSKEYKTFAFTLDDKFGSNGLICVVILEKQNKTALFIDTWLMSCRVLKRGMENFVLNEIVEYARENKITTLRGEYIPTKKNDLVKDHYQNLGFKKEGDIFTLNLDNYKNKNNHINKN